METKHTQGKWHVINVYSKNHDHWSGYLAINDDDLAANYGAEVAAQEIEIICICENITEELAKLIAAAPDLLQALSKTNESLTTLLKTAVLTTTQRAFIGITIISNEDIIQKATD